MYKITKKGKKNKISWEKAKVLRKVFDARRCKNAVLDENAEVYVVGWRLSFFS